MGDTAGDSKKLDEAIGHYSNALSLDPTNLNDILLRRSNEVWIVFHVTQNVLDDPYYLGYRARPIIPHKV